MDLERAQWDRNNSTDVSLVEIRQRIRRKNRRSSFIRRGMVIQKCNYHSIRPDDAKDMHQFVLLQYQGDLFVDWLQWRGRDPLVVGC
mmetsp:Transcript_9406/g.20933  ORF Transcript_9406/g.20933 Transcript_9406/m.20933 type:complete len:87 (+) Transcript_9406:126-386(+)